MREKAMYERGRCCYIYIRTPSLPPSIPSSHQPSIRSQKLARGDRTPCISCAAAHVLSPHCYIEREGVWQFKYEAIARAVGLRCKHERALYRMREAPACSICNSGGVRVWSYLNYTSTARATSKWVRSRGSTFVAAMVVGGLTWSDG